MAPKSHMPDPLVPCAGKGVVCEARRLTLSLTEQNRTRERCSSLGKIKWPRLTVAQLPQARLCVQRAMRERH